MRPTPSTRRHLLGASGGIALAAMLPLPALAHANAATVCRVLAISDLHSAYERTSQLLAAFEHEVRSHPAPHVIALNGDIFEHANMVSVRSDGLIDWAFLAALPRIAPTVVNLGNHDNDLTNDLAEVVARMRGLGLHVVTHLHDSRTGQPYADPVIDLAVGERRLRVVGIGTDALHTYPKAGRERLTIPASQDWAAQTLAKNLEGSDLRMVLCHVGVPQERLILPHVPPRSLVIGGHNHLLFTAQLGSIAYAHSGSWNNAYTVAEFDGSGAVSVRNLNLDTLAPVNPELSALIAATLAQHLTDDEQAILGHAPSTLSLGHDGQCRHRLHRPHHLGHGRPSRPRQPIRL
jgi:5'-nucleotidase/UDP-sugar diphosphatase